MILKVLKFGVLEKLFVRNYRILNSLFDSTAKFERSVSFVVLVWNFVKVL